ncbi:protein kintoun [Engystomops pustulosus]|uniref:protein kintoun n=1 Tax=Engystomops pustulosus TaxID=76066 RepID=UPI003AFB3D7A
MATKLDELSVTSEELERFKVAFQDARFRELFAQYAQEISNPENRRRYEQEISEMERERGVDIQFIHPEPGHVLQTSVNGQQTCYLNVCGNALVRKPQCVIGTDKEGRPGQHWSLPCTLTPPREELSPGGSKEVIYDVVFHPDTLLLASRNEKFRAMVDLTALDTVSKQFKVVLDSRNVSTPSDKYKGVPQATVIRKPRAGAAPKPQDPTDPLRFPYPYNNPREQTRHGRNYRHQPLRTNGESKAQCQEPTTPHYTIRHRSYVDLQDYRDSRDSAPSPVPKELVITVDMPLLYSSSDVDLHIKGKNLSLKSQKPAYKLELKLPYLVEDERGTAQFNKIKRQLVITVPVVQQNILQMMQNISPDPQHTNPPANGEEEAIPPNPNGTTEPSEPDQDEKSQAAAAEGGPQLSLPQDTPECPIFTCSQDATSLTLIIHVKHIDEHSVTSEVSSYQCEIRFCVKLGNLPYVLFVGFLPQYNLNTHHIAVNVSEDNMVIELTKSPECFGLWKNLFFGVNSNSLQERRFINEENVAEFLENGLRPSTIPWSTLEDQPLINVLGMTDRRTHIQLSKPELEGKPYLTAGEQISDVSKVTERMSFRLDNTSLSDTGEEEGRQSPDQAVHLALPAPHTPASDDSAEEDKGLCFKEITPAGELDEDDLPDRVVNTESPDPKPATLEPALKEVNPLDGSVHDVTNQRTQCAFKFENPVLFDLD